MSKEIAGDLFARIDLPFELYKDLQDTWEYQEHLSLQKIYKKSDRELYKQSSEWIEANNDFIKAIGVREEIESEIRVKNQLDSERDTK